MAVKQCYEDKAFRPATLALIETMNDIIGEYRREGFVLTVRQLYYQLVARAIIPNTLQEYKRAASIINDGKLAGLIDWGAIEDRTREFIRVQRWDNGAHILRAAIRGYHKDMWVGQDVRVFVIVEKEALVGVLENVCAEFDSPLLAARGYPSGTVLREFAQADIIPALDDGQRPVILHLGDHDPSGIDMSRDLEERLSLFTERTVTIRRIALNMEQVEEKKPPKNPAKMTDSRFTEYARKFGRSSWELDALSPTYLADIVRQDVESYIDWDLWNEILQEVDDTKQRIEDLAHRFED